MRINKYHDKVVMAFDFGFRCSFRLPWLYSEMWHATHLLKPLKDGPDGGKATHKVNGKISEGQIERDQNALLYVFYVKMKMLPKNSVKIYYKWDGCCWWERSVTTKFIRHHKSFYFFVHKIMTQFLRRFLMRDTTENDKYRSALLRVVGYSTRIFVVVDEITLHSRLIILVWLWFSAI